jgi:hypothetical protein
MFLSMALPWGGGICAAGGKERWLDPILARDKKDGQMNISLRLQEPESDVSAKKSALGPPKAMFV